jgi:uncharacterized membrane protein
MMMLNDHLLVVREKIFFVIILELFYVIMVLEEIVDRPIPFVEVEFYEKMMINVLMSVLFRRCLISIHHLLVSGRHYPS